MATTQRERNAAQAREKMEARREDADGAAGWVAERAGQWDLEGVDDTFMARQKYLWNPLMDYWFRMEIEGWEHLPESPVLLIGIHSGAPFVWDAWTVGIQWWRRFGTDRPLGHDVALWPGGEIDSLRPWTDRDEAVLAGRKGFIRMAIRAGVPIVPIATVGGPDSMPVLARGRRLAKLLQLERVARLKMFPITLQAPWGISPAILPELPLPTKIRTAFQPPVKLSRDPAKAKDDDYVDRKYEEVRASIQGGMDALARRRTFPVFG
jgi:1-acyl-sn-glycerol-3-phosphate acyltransferase